MYIVRPIEAADAARVEKLVSRQGIGIDNLPKNRQEIEEAVNQTHKAFAQTISEPLEEKYYFVLEEIETGQLIGFCGIFSRVGYTMPRYFYRIEAMTPEMKVLRVTSDNSYPSEMCALFLDATCRGGGLGKLLSLSRLLFIACHPERFRPKVMAEMRAYINKRGKIPFWELVAKHFTSLRYEQIVPFLRQNPYAIFDMIPKYPLYISILPKEARLAIGRVNANSLPALKMLHNEGLTFCDEVSLFDASSNILAPTQQLRSIRMASSSIVLAITKDDANLSMKPTYLLANERLKKFRCCYGTIVQDVEADSVTIEQRTARALELAIGDKIRTLPLF